MHTFLYIANYVETNPELADARAEMNHAINRIDLYGASGEQSFNRILSIMFEEQLITWTKIEMVSFDWLPVKRWRHCHT